MTVPGRLLPIVLEREQAAAGSGGGLLPRFIAPSRHANHVDGYNIFIASFRYMNLQCEVQPHHLYVDTGQIITSAGSAAAIDMLCTWWGSITAL